MQSNAIPSESTFAHTFARLAGPALIATALAGFALSASPANAAECVNGYRTLGNQVIVQCDDAFGGATVDQFSGANAILAEPATTGSIPAARSGRMVVDSISDCQPGAYRIMEKEDGDVIIAC